MSQRVSLLVAASLLAAGAPAAAGTKLVSGGISYGQIRRGAIGATLTVSPDGRRVAYVVQRGGR